MGHVFQQGKCLLWAWVFKTGWWGMGDSPADIALHVTHLLIFLQPLIQIH